MGEAAAGDDIERVGLMAYAASGYALTVQVALMQAPAWEPGAAAVDALIALSEDLVSGLELIDAATQEVERPFEPRPESRIDASETGAHGRDARDALGRILS